MLGRDLVSMLIDRGESVATIDRDEVDVTDAAATVRAMVRPDVVVNCAAYTAVDAAEKDEANAFAVNALGAANVARAAYASGARLVHISTDYVFSGAATTPYSEDEPPAPQSAYGRTKLAGEWAVRAEHPDHLLVRTAWLYGAHGGCFPRTVARAAKDQGKLDVVSDQIGQPTWTRDLAGLIVRLVDARAASGIYHGTSSGSSSWCDFAQAVVSSAGMDPRIVHPTMSDAAARPARRPAYSVLGHAALAAAGIPAIGDWRVRWEAAAHEVLVGT